LFRNASVVRLENPCYNPIMLLMPRKKTKTSTSVRLNSHMLERLDALADRIGRTRSDLIDRAVQELIERMEADSAPPVEPARPSRPKR
jgi:hypothetical protein